jgi:hypothetical protein
MYLAVPLSTHFEQESMADWIASWMGMAGKWIFKTFDVMYNDDV